MGNAKLIISLDCELHWGVFDTLEDRYDNNITGARSAIKKILELFYKYEIHATWATVGMLFNKNKDDFDKYKPNLLPSYQDKKLSPYYQDIGEDENRDKLHYGHSIIELIRSYPNQEIASHSYSHYYCKAGGQTKDEFEEDIKSAVKIARDKFGIELKSFVFPKNEINYDYLDILIKYGFDSYRGNPMHWIYKNGQQTSIIGKIIRTFDSYMNITGNNCSTVRVKNGLLNIVGNRFLRPYRNNFLNKLMIKRTKSEMLCAAKNDKLYHLWWHPHNFGIDQNQHLKNLEEILSYYQFLKEEFSMKSLCMRDIKQ